MDGKSKSLYNRFMQLFAALSKIYPKELSKELEKWLQPIVHNVKAVNEQEILSETVQIFLMRCHRTLDIALWLVNTRRTRSKDEWTSMAGWFSEGFWSILVSDSAYVFSNEQGTIGKHSLHDRSLEEVNQFDRELRHRQEISEKMIGKKKLFQNLYEEHGEACQEYLSMCIKFHSYILIRELYSENDRGIDDFIDKITGNVLSSDVRIYLRKSLRKVAIPLQQYAKSLNNVTLQPISREERDKKTTTDFIPSIPENSILPSNPNGSTSPLTSVLQDHRWCVVLSDPGYGKTSLLRWLTLQYAQFCIGKTMNVMLKGDKYFHINTNNDECLSEDSDDTEMNYESDTSEQQENNSNKIDNEIVVGPTKMPILIQVTELVEWLKKESHKTDEELTLFNYIGKHTWMGHPYNPTQYSANMLHDFIRHDHALILIDGLDEVSSNLEMRRRIVYLIESFVIEHARSPVQFSIDDDPNIVAHWCGSYYILNVGHTTVDRPAYTGGNQVIITSRITGYTFWQLRGEFFAHYQLGLLKSHEVAEFVYDWLYHMVKSIKGSLRAIQIDDISLKNFDTYAKTTESIMGEELIEDDTDSNLWCHPMLLTIACSILFRNGMSYSKKRIALYSTAVNSSLQSVSSISPTILTRVFEYLATYLQRYSASGLTDTFDLERIVKTALRSLGDYKSEAEKELIANVFKEDSNCTIAVARGLDAYGFSHRLFQEYFMAMALVRMTETTMTSLHAKVIADRLIRYGMYSNYRQPILLAIGWLSFHLSTDQFDVICMELVSRKYSAMPIGALLLLETITMMYRSLTIGILIVIFDTLFAVEYGANFDGYILRALDTMSDNVVSESITDYIQLEGRAERFCLFLNRACRMTAYTGPNASSDLLWFSPSIRQALWSSQFDTIQEKSNLDLALWITSIATMSPYIRKIEPGFDLQSFLIERNTQCDQIHPLILSLIIALNGGLDLQRSCDDDFSVVFSPHLMHRPSENAIAQMIITYFTDDTSDHNTKINYLIKYCEQTIRNTIATDTSWFMINLCIALICLRGVHEPSIFQEFYNYSAFSRSLSRFKQILIHLRQLYSDIDKSTFLEANELLNEIVLQPQTDINSFTETVAIALIRLTTKDRSVLEKNLTVSIEKYCSQTILFVCPGVYEPTDEKEEALMIDQNQHPYQVHSANPFFCLAFLPRSLRLIFERLILTKRLNSVSNSLLLLEVLLAIGIDKTRQPTQRLILLLQQLDPMFVNCGLDALSFFILLDIFRSDRTNLASSSLKTFIKQKCSNIEDDALLASLSCTVGSDYSIRLFTSSVILARYAITLLPLNYLELIDQALSYIHTLDDQVLKLFGLCIFLHIVYSYIDKNRYDQLLTDIVDTTEGCLHTSCSIPLLIHTLLFKLCGPICQTKSSHTYEKCFNNLINRLSIIPDSDEYEHDQEIAYISIQDQYPCPIPDVILTRINLGEKLYFKSKQFHDYFDSFTSTSSKHTTLLSAMYLSELTADVRILEKIVTPSETKCLVDQVKIILKKSQPIFTCEASLLTDEVLRSEVMYPALLEIEIFLRECTICEPTSRYILEQWLDTYRHIKDRCTFAHIAAVLLLEQGVSSSLAIEILYNDILPNDIDWIQLRARQCLNNVKCGISWNHSLCSNLLKYAFDHVKLSIYLIKDMQELMTLEKTKVTRLSYFQLIHCCSNEVKTFIEKSIVSLNEDEGQHLNCMISHLGHFIEKSDQWLVTLENILRNDRLICTHRAVARSLCLHIEGRQIIINFINEQMSNAELCTHTLIPCLEALYSQPGDQDELNQIDTTLHTLWQSTSSSVTLHAGACYLYYRHPIGTSIGEVLTDLNLDVLTLYKIIMLNERAHLWANRLLHIYSSQLGSQFFIDLFDIVCGRTNDRCVAIFLLAAQWMAKNDREKFCKDVRLHLIDETRFKTALYETCLRLDSPLQTIPRPSHLTSSIHYWSVSRICLQIYSTFGTLTAEWLKLFLIHSLDYDQYCLNISIYCIKLIQRVEDRDLIESLFEYLKSTSIRHRYLIVYLLIHIASIDLLSFAEVYELLGEVINDSESQQSFVGQNEKRHTLSEEIRYLLLKYSCIEIIEQDNTPLVSWITAEVDYMKAFDDSLLVSSNVSDS